MSGSATAIGQLLAQGRLQQAEWLMRQGAPSPINLEELAQKLGTELPFGTFYVSPGYYAPLSSWSEAEECCGKAYQADSVVERYRIKVRAALEQHRTQQPIGLFAIRQLAAMQHAWLSLGQPSTLRVLDFGGALGDHLHNLSPYWPWSRLEWTVCETTAVASAGAREFASSLKDGHELQFSDQPTAALDRGIDLVFASGSLQFIENWLELLSKLATAPWVLIDRIPLVQHPEDLIAIQVVPASYTDTRYPGWKFSETSWLPRVMELGLEPVLQWFVPEDRWSVLDLNSGEMRWSAPHDQGFLLSRATASSTKKPMIF